MSRRYVESRVKVLDSPRLLTGRGKFVDDLTFPRRAHFSNPVPWTFTNGAHLAVVEIDVEVGAVRVLRYVAVDDCGRVVNPALVEGQVAGGIAQSLGAALCERCVYDEAGQLLTATLMDYALPTAADVPALAAILYAVNDALHPRG